jgi:DnaJ-class molecular chaperone
MVDEHEAYRLLGVAPGATPAEVRAAFRRRVMEQHPDTSAGGDDDSSVQDLVDAYRLLATPGGGNVEGARIRVRHESARARRTCVACDGTGRRAEPVVCPDCAGSAGLTTLEVDRARVTWCHTCEGRGRRNVVSRCKVCGGSGGL